MGRDSKVWGVFCEGKELEFGYKESKKIQIECQMKEIELKEKILMNDINLDFIQRICLYFINHLFYHQSILQLFQKLRHPYIPRHQKLLYLSGDMIILQRILYLHQPLFIILRLLLTPSFNTIIKLIQELLILIPPLFCSNLFLFLLVIKQLYLTYYLFVYLEISY